MSGVQFLYITDLCWFSSRQNAQVYFAFTRSVKPSYVPFCVFRCSSVGCHFVCVFFPRQIIIAVILIRICLIIHLTLGSHLTLSVRIPSPALPRIPYLKWVSPELHISYIWTYTGCNRRNGPDFGRVFLMLNYTEKPQNTYTQS